MLDETQEPVRRFRVSLRVLQVGVIAVVLAATTHKAFELDRFLIPKELVLHLAAALAALFAIGLLRRVPFTRVDMLLIGYLLLSGLSAAFSTNYWLGMRGFALSASCVLIFWTARALRIAGLERALLSAVAVAIIVAAATSLAQAYGVRIDLFSLNRSPGGTLGNRNFVAHAAAFGLPLCMFVALQWKRWWAYGGIAVVTAALVLTRSRAAWLAAAAMLLVFLAGMLRVEGKMWARLGVVVVLAAAGAAAALIIPNTLRWRSDNPYLESVTGVVNYEEGSGRGRLRQYGRTLVMAFANPIFGVGPGNWPVVYPKFALRNDPSMDPSEDGMTFNPWPSSDWVAFVAERGVAATVLLALAFGGIALRAFKAQGVTRATMLAVLVAAVVTGMFDAVLLLALPGMIVWAALGALFPDEEGGQTGASVFHWGVVVLLVSIGGVVRSGAQIAAMEIHASGRNPEAGSQIDPGNYRIHMRLARDCDHAKAARDLFPNATAARVAARRCD